MYEYLKGKYPYMINNIDSAFYIFCEPDSPLYERIGITPHVISMALVIGSERAALNNQELKQELRQSLNST